VPLSGGAVGRESELVRAMIELGHALGPRVVAEGVEDDQALELLGSLNCDLVQDYAVGRPAPAAELAPAAAADADPNRRGFAAEASEAVHLCQSGAAADLSLSGRG